MSPVVLFPLPVLVINVGSCSSVGMGLTKIHSHVFLHEVRVLLSRKNRREI